MPADGRLSAEQPFPGLRPFEFSESAFFFGRAEQTYALYRLLELSQFVAVVGSSGSGKSSIVRAGLLPLLAVETEEEAEQGSDAGWRSIELRPGEAPLERLADRLAALTAPAPAAGEENPLDRAARRERIAYALRRSSFGLTEAIAGSEALAGRALLIVVDQFEELFRYQGSGADRGRFQREAAQFVQLLLEATSGRERKVHVLITLRSDFIGDCARFYGLPEAVSACQFLVPALTRDQLEEIVRRPLAAADATIESELVERLLNDAADDLDQLPVLQHCLQQLWEESQRQARPGERPRLTLGGYDTVGRMQHALSRHANRIMERLPGDELAIEQVFRALSALDADNRATRRALPFAQLLTETGVDEATLRRVLERFRADDCSFIVPSPSLAGMLAPGTRIDVGHEVLLRRWDKISAEPTLEVGERSEPGGWLYREVHDGQIYRALLALLEGGGTLPLDQVEMRWRWWTERPRTAAWAERYGGRIERVRQLFANSRKALDAERTRRQRTYAAIALAFVVLLGAAVFAFWQRHLAAQEQARAASALTEKTAALHADTKDRADKAVLQTMVAGSVKSEDAFVFQMVQTYLDANGAPKYGAPAPLLQGILALTITSVTQLDSMHEQTQDLDYDKGAALGETADLLLWLGEGTSSLHAANDARATFIVLARTRGEDIDRQGLEYADRRIGDAYRALNNLGQALASYQEALTIATTLAKKAPFAADWRQADLLLIYGKEGGTLETRKGPGDLAQAGAMYAARSALALSLAKLDPADVAWQGDRAILLDGVANSAVDPRDAGVALAADEAWLSARRQRYASAPGPATKSELVLALADVSFDLLLARRPEDALARAGEAQKLAPDAMWAEVDRAHALLFLGRFDEAREIYLRDSAQAYGDGRTVAAAVRDDFAEFAKFHIDTPDMKRIEALLN